MNPLILGLRYLIRIYFPWAGLINPGTLVMTGHTGHARANNYLNANSKASRWPSIGPQVKERKTHFILLELLYGFRSLPNIGMDKGFVAFLIVLHDNGIAVVYGELRKGEQPV